MDEQLRTGTTAGALRDAIWTHPSIGEGLNEVLEAPIRSTLQPS